MQNIHWNTDSPEYHSTNVKLKGRKEGSVGGGGRKQGMTRDRLESPEIYLISERKQNGMQEKGREITCENRLKKKHHVFKLKGSILSRIKGKTVIQITSAKFREPNKRQNA